MEKGKRAGGKARTSLARNIGLEPRRPDKSPVQFEPCMRRSVAFDTINDEDEAEPDDEKRMRFDPGVTYDNTAASSEANRRPPGKMRRFLASTRFAT